MFYGGSTFIHCDKEPEAGRSGSKSSLSHHSPGLTWLKKGADKAPTPQRDRARGTRGPMASPSLPSMASKKRPQWRAAHKTGHAQPTGSSDQMHRGRQVTCVVLRVKNKNLLEMAHLVYRFQVLKLYKQYDLSPMNTKLFLQGATFQSLSIMSFCNLNN